jgi:hypothetical protein
MVDLNLSTNRIQYGKVSVDKAIQFNHRALSFANTLTQVFINIFSNNLQGLKF